jgi:uncharacterized membrane protein YdcZ (DUF606 family)
LSAAGQAGAILRGLKARETHMEALTNIGWAAIFAIVGGLVGVALVMLSLLLLPRLLDRLTPNLDEDKEIARGNQAVAEYFGRVVSAGILGVSIVAAAAVLGGIIAALHG